MAAITVLDDFVQYLMMAQMNLDTGGNVIKAVIHTDASVEATDNDITDFTQISATGGYTTKTLANQDVTEPSTGTFMFDADDVVWTASGANFDAGRYVGLYNDTQTSPVADGLICDWDYGANFTLTDGNTFTVVFNANGIIRAS